MDAPMTQAISKVALAVANALHGQREPIYQAAMAELGIGRSTLLRYLKAVSVTKARKQRCDAGDYDLSRDEADILSGYCMAGFRKNNRKITSLKEAVEVLRMNGVIKAERLDEATGECVPLSDSAIARALRAYRLHPEQLRIASAYTRLQSLHPNHVWEVDASVCVIYYLPDGSSELVELDDAVHYKNKPQNLKAIEQFRVIRYVLADHCSGVLRWRYFPHAESGEHTVRFLAWAMAERAGDPFHGAPLIVMVDPGATSGGLVARFCQRVGIELIINKVGNARAKGSVEKGNHLIETSFEQTLRYLKPRPTNFEQLNALADTYQLWWNATKIHSRHGKTRFDVWLLITAEQLRITPSSAVLLELATKAPETRQVQGDLSISFKNRTWNVEKVPGVYVKGTVAVHWHPFIADTAMAVVMGEDGHEVHIALPELKKNDFGFVDSAATIGDDYQARPDSIVDINRKRVAAIAAGVSGLEAVEKKQKSKNYTPFDGAIDPLIASKVDLPSFIPKRGTDLGVVAPTRVMERLSPAAMGKYLKGLLGVEWDGSMMTGLLARFPEGATVEELEGVLADIRAGRSVEGKAKLRAV